MIGYLKGTTKSVSQDSRIHLKKVTIPLLYYGFLIGMTLFGIGYGYIFSERFFPSDKPYLAQQIMIFLKVCWLLPLPYALINFYSFLRYPIYKSPITIPIQQQPLTFPHTFYFRYVTRGQNPNLVKENVALACSILQKLLPEGHWAVEVVTDKRLPLATDNQHVCQIVVPEAYETANGTKFKARSLQYALTASSATQHDWIIHLDEETQFDEETVAGIYQFVAREHLLTMAGQQAHPRIGQGIIVYGSRHVENWLTTLADSIRVGDDYGRFRLQFKQGKAHFGMHGSFIVINNGLEQMIGLDHGPDASITEDTFFALVAQSMGIEFAFLPVRMYEKSPFSVKDFIRQRHRWFEGLWYCVRSSEIPLKDRFLLGVFMLFWSLSWTSITVMIINVLYPTSTPVWLAITAGLAFAYNIAIYLIGFFKTFSWQDGKRRYLGLLVLQLLFSPLFSIMEGVSVLYGLVKPTKAFYVVQKEV